VHEDQRPGGLGRLPERQEPVIAQAGAGGFARFQAAMR